MVPLPNRSLTTSTAFISRVSVARWLARFHIQLELALGPRLQVHQHHTGLGEVEAGFVDAMQPADRRADDGGGIRTGPAQQNDNGARVLRVLLPERTGADEHHDAGQKQTRVPPLPPTHRISRPAYLWRSVLASVVLPHRDPVYITVITVTTVMTTVIAASSFVNSRPNAA